MSAPKAMCPHCGALFAWCELTPLHAESGTSLLMCPGSQQNPRCPESDARPLWNGRPNPHFGAVVVPEGTE